MCIRDRAELKDAQGNAVGTVQFNEADGVVHVTIDVDGLTPGFHAIHIHQNADCSTSDFMSAGPHYNPTHKEHGVYNPNGSHVGDFPNLLADNSGHAHLELNSKLFTLGEGETSVFKEGGTAVIVHFGVDDMISDPSGNAGGRYACGEIHAA